MLPRLLSLVILTAATAQAATPVPVGDPPVTLEKLRRGNLLTEGLPGWEPYPSADLVKRPMNAPNGVLELEPGAALLAAKSLPIPVESGGYYTLAFEIRQVEIPIGFDMGGSLELVWARKNGGSLTQRFGVIDGSFDWTAVSHSVVAPPEAVSVRVCFCKNGSPGTVFYRNPVFGRGVLERAKKELSPDDFLRDEASFHFLLTRLDDFFAVKGALPIPGVAAGRKAFEAKVKAEGDAVRADAAAFGRSSKEESRGAIVWNEMLKGSLGFQVAPDSPYHARWKALLDEAEHLEAVADRWIAGENGNRLEAAMRDTFGSFQGYALGVDSPMSKTPSNAPYLGPVAREASLALARNEEESVQLTLAALERDLGGISVEAGPFKGEGGIALPESAVSISRIDCVKTVPPQYYGGPVAWWPDVVFPARSAEAIPKGTKQSFWVTVAANAGTPPGEYRGDLVIKEHGETLQSLPLSIKVWDITLPKPGKFKVIGRFAPGELNAFYHWKTDRPDIKARWNRYIVQKRWNPTSCFSPGITPSGEELSAAVSAGLNAINLLDPSKYLTYDRANRIFKWPTAEQEAALAAGVQKSLKAFKDAGGTPATTLYLCGFDEQHDRSQYPLMKHVFDLAKKAAPEARIATTTTYPPLGELAGTVHTWIPLLGSEPSELEPRRRAGDEFFFYFYGHPYRPFPNPSIIDYPGIDSRITFWLAAKKGYTGCLHWLMNGWSANVPKEGEEGWPKRDWVPYDRAEHSVRNGEGYFLYPGPDGQPISSVRFELMRDGIEDWELLEMLKEAVAAAEKAGKASAALSQAKEALAEAGRLTPDFEHHSLDPAALMAARAKAAEALIALTKDGK